MRVCGKIAGIAGARVARRCAVRDAPALSDALQARAVSVEVRTCPDWGGLMREPVWSRLPDGLLDTVANWIDDGSDATVRVSARDVESAVTLTGKAVSNGWSPWPGAWSACVRTGRLHPTRCRADPVDYQYGGQSACRRRSVCGSAGAIARGIGYQQPAYRFERHRRQWPACERRSVGHSVFGPGDCRYRIRSGLAEGAGASRDRCVRDLLRRVRVASCRLARAFRWRDCGQSSGFHLATRRNARECRQ